MKLFVEIFNVTNVKSLLQEAHLRSHRSSVKTLCFTAHTKKPQMNCSQHREKLEAVFSGEKYEISYNNLKCIFFL